MKNIIVTVLFAAIAAASGRAQETARYALSIPVDAGTVKGAPYSAEFVAESIQTLADGNRIVERTTGRIYRDREGRVRREEDRPDGVTISVTDPVARRSFTLDTATKTAKQTPALLIIDVNRKVRAMRELLVQVQKQEGSARARGAGTPTQTVAPGGRGGGGGRGRGGAATLGSETIEKLPDRALEGVQASGVRRTTTIAKGVIGNEQPIIVVSEEWTSPELQVLVLSEFSDPRTGRRTYRLSRINRADPDPALFQVPAGYTIVKVPPPVWLKR